MKIIIKASVILLMVNIVLSFQAAWAQKYIALNQSNQTGNLVCGGGTEAEYADILVSKAQADLVALGYVVKIFSGNPSYVPAAVNTWNTQNGGANALVSMHTNATVGGCAGTANGTTTYYHPNYKASDVTLAGKVQAGLVSCLKLKDNGFTAHWLDLAVLRGVIAPCCLEEALFHDNLHDTEVLKSTAGQDAIANGVSNGIDAFFGGKGNPCDGGTPALPNDNPCDKGVPLLTVGTTCSFVQGSNVGATNSSVPLLTNCDGQSNGDLWFKFVVPFSGHVIITSNAGSINDMGMALYTGSGCNSLSYYGCYPNGSSYSQYMPYADVSGLKPYDTVWIRMWEFNNNNFGTFGVCVTSPETTCTDNFESNDNASTSTLVYANPLGTTAADYNLNATLGYGGDQDWYKINLSSCGTLTVTLSDLPADYDLELYGSDGQGQLIRGSTNTGTTSEQVVFLSATSSPTTLYARVYSGNASTFNATACYRLNFKWASSAITPSVSISASPSEAVCTGQSIIFTAIPSNAGTSPVYQWKKNGVIVSTDPSFSSNTLANGDVIYCLLTSSSPCAGSVTATSNTITLTVTDPVTPVITQKFDSLVSGEASGNQWYFNSGVIANATKQAYKPAQNGLYYVKVTKNGCLSGPSNTINVQNVGIVKADNVSAGIYPNPNDGQFTFTYKAANDQRIRRLDLYNMSGQLIKVWSTGFQGTEVIMPVDLRGLPAGMYSLLIRTQYKDHVLKFIIR